MKKLILFFGFLCTLTLCVGQEFYFQMYFEDAVANKDTITLGYDAIASDSIDVSFGEINIISVPFDTGLDVRISNEWLNRSCCSRPGSFHTKRQIIPYDCMPYANNPIISIDIKTKHWPVTAYWNKNLFTDSCRKLAVFTSINPGGWWDTGSPSDLAQQFLISNGSATFSSNSTSGYNENYSYINGDDIIPFFWQSFDAMLSTSIKETTNDMLSIFPNPATSQLFIQTTDFHPQTLSIFDMSGRKVMEEKYSPQIDISALQAGGYFIELRNEETVVRKRWVKVN